MFRHHHRHQFSGNHELCSAFYTNNPLLYVSHYSEIIVAAGYEVSRQHELSAHGDLAAAQCWRSTSHVGQSSSAVAAARRPESLATRREAVELLNCDAALISYLVQNGAVSRLDVEHVEREKLSSARQNIALLRCVDRAGRSGLSLLLNALRHTGQYQLANLLDTSPRIIPPLPGVELSSCTPGFPSSARHKGQITIEIRVASVKLKSGGLCGSDWITLSDIESYIDLLQQSAPQLRHRAHPNRKFKSSPGAALSSRRRYRLQQVPEDRRHSTTSASQSSTALFRFTTAITPNNRTTAVSMSEVEPEASDDRKYSRLLSCLAACLVGRKHYLRQVGGADVNVSPVSRRSAYSESSTSSTGSLPVGSSSREFQTAGVNCLLAGIELSGGFRMSLGDGAVIRMSKDRREKDVQLSPGQPRRPFRQISSVGLQGAPDDWPSAAPRHQRHLAIARLRRTAEQLRAKIASMCEAFSASAGCADDLELRDRLVRYFERSCWVPVLDVVPAMEGDERQAAVAVVVCCTTPGQLAALRHHYNVGLLRDDVQRHLLPSVDVADGSAAGHGDESQRRRLLGDGDDSISDAVIDVVIDRDELELVKMELTQLLW